MAKKYDDFDEADQDGVFDQVFRIISNHRKAFAIVTVVAAVAVLGLIVVDSYPGDSEQAAADSVPIVRADSGEYKVRPDNPGGMEIPYRDSTVFSAAETPADGGPENILSDETAEQPVSRDSAFAGLNTEGAATSAPSNATLAPAGEPQAAADAPTLNRVEPVLAPDRAPMAAAPATTGTLVQEAIGTTAPEGSTAPTETAAAMPPQPILPDNSAPEPKAEAKPEPAKVEPAAGTTAAKVTPGGSYVQLASVKDKSGAAGEFKKMQVKYSALSGLNFRTQQADLGAKGTFHRIQAGPMSKESASKVCASVKSAGGSCLVVAK